MGSGVWSASSYHERVATYAKAGRDAFDYHHAALRSGKVRPHQTLDPSGLHCRESRDSEEHPESNSIIISLDVTGSMDRVVRGIHGDLPQLHELLLGHQSIPHPQILFAAVGDATCDRVPLQVGQFESDNRMDQNLENMILEGGGGGQKTESYELMLYVAARHTAIDCWEKRKRRGYLFMIGDEMAYPCVKRHEVKRLIGTAPQYDVPLDEIVSEVQQKYHLYFVIPGGAHHGRDQDVIDFWKASVGPQRVIRLEQPEDVSECIALAIGVNEGAIDPHDSDSFLQRGMASRGLDRVRQALAALVPGGSTVRSSRARRL